MGNLRRVTPISRLFGADRGACVDRHYIEQFLATHATDIRGRVLELENDAYTRRFGGDRVTRSDVLHLTSDNPKATIVADLTRLDGVAAGTFECIILTQTLQFVYDVPAALSGLHRILKPGGTLLATVPGISQISRYDLDRSGEFWRFTSMSATRLFAETFSEQNVSVRAYGNVLSAASFLFGVSADELRARELEFRDPDYEVTIAVRAVKSETA